MELSLKHLKIIFLHFHSVNQINKIIKAGRMTTKPEKSLQDFWVRVYVECLLKEISPFIALDTERFLLKSADLRVIKCI